MVGLHSRMVAYTGDLSRLVMLAVWPLQGNAKWQEARQEQEAKARLAAEEALRAQLHENRLQGKWANVIANGYQDRAEYFRYGFSSFP